MELNKCLQGLQALMRKGGRVLNNQAGRGQCLAGCTHTCACQQKQRGWALSVKGQGRLTVLFGPPSGSYFPCAPKPCAPAPFRLKSAGNFKHLVLPRRDVPLARIPHHSQPVDRGVAEERPFLIAGQTAHAHAFPPLAVNRLHPRRAGEVPRLAEQRLVHPLVHGRAAALCAHADEDLVLREVRHFPIRHFPICHWEREKQQPQPHERACAILSSFAAHFSILNRFLSRAPFQLLPAGKG
mmetsp:Transcript_20217/g.64308  ORF Transcript_20217/g.64308 Transcript_20217/m.64308 type:complete len:240 (-) Transcript_20217:117-836(-)